MLAVELSLKAPRWDEAEKVPSGRYKNMTLNALQALTWSTVAGAVAGALLLASVESNFSDWSRTRRANTEPRLGNADLATQRKSQERPPVLMDASVAKREVAVR
ncbi:hypothetical protein DZC73_11700 [Albitalea terrae]|uniref:Uncharacterized protein n=1 Tax=Piscinibacter terrae TaxID=2496871 RepID=A0A3N7HPC9_9BURK|nr:hypothetical protein DZC73_11700 [Albitalea terrae]